MIKTRDLVIGALLTALAIIIPTAFKGWLQVQIPPFSATLASHVPTMLAMFISPWVAGIVGLGSTIGFAMTLPAFVAARASTHILFGVIGALLYRRGLSPWAVLIITLPIHAIAEALVVIPFGFTMYQAWIVTGVGTGLHHIADSAITVSLWMALTRTGLKLRSESA